MRAEDLPGEAIRAWRLLRLGVSLTEQGYSEPPAVLLDWLIQLDSSFNKVQNEERS